MKRIIFSLLYLIIPSILISTLGYMDSAGSLFLIFVVCIYLLLIAGLIFYFKFRLCGFPALLSGLILSPALVFIYESIQNSEYFKYLVTVLSAVYCALPLAIIATVIYVAHKRKVKA